ncbi:TrmH family RNA methyltransferase [Microbacterium amylolyticum]|uniref:tRNA G18 (Ribose-2'-O)-methylase SpoU n=1 Tax=Microbacterium amylolyticum TaxID=936337 RepID=A0ABS4ZFR1_9MICO|nr:RNA methyltransferase [Microbacterium amylolyticum]MBP2435825.1 tRNA G18 (ribose-2'-O)-methylase SpoU [Microbacterium amylolyticum]
MQRVHIDDPADPQLADYRNLTDVALRRVLEPQGGLYMAESAKVLGRAIAAGHAPRSVLTAEKWLDDVEELVGDSDIPVFVVPDAVAEQVTGYTVHRGILAAMHRPALPSVAEVLRDARTVLVLEDIVDHTNVGAAFRGAAGLGADAVLVTPRCADPLYRRSVRVSMGTVFQVPWTRLPEWRTKGGDGAAEVLHASGFHIAAMALAEDAVPLDRFAAERPERVAFAMGSEGPGLSRWAQESADTKVIIPMAGGVDSLNVASASAVALWALQHPPA